MYSSALLALLPAAALALTQRSDPAPLLGPGDNATVIPGKYIVKFRDGVSTSSVQSTVGALAANADHVFEEGFMGFAGHLDEAALQAVRNHGDVEYIEKDVEFSINNCYIQRTAPWGLGRIGNPKRGIRSYVFGRGAGEGTCTYVIDTGIDDRHPEFQGRAKQVKSFVSGQNTDGQGHGTHCAGIVGSKTYGVAKKTRLFGVKALDNRGSGPVSNVVAAMQFVRQDMRRQRCPKGVVVSLSLGGPISRASNDAANALVSAGAFVAVAAGNDHRDASAVSPASAQNVCAVGASDQNDVTAKFSNFGKVVAVYAPGVDIMSTIPGGRTGVFSGTSQATPHVAGLAAYLMSKERIRGPQMCSRIKAISQKNLLRQVPRHTTNRLAFTGGPRACV